MSRRLRRAAAIALSAALVAASAGFDAQRAAAQTLTGRMTRVSPTPNPALPPLSFLRPAPAFAAPSALSGAVLVAAPAAAAASVAETVAAVAPALEALAKPEVVGSQASVAGRQIEDVLAEGRSISVSGEADPSLREGSAGRLSTNFGSLRYGPVGRDPTAYGSGTSSRYRSVVAALSPSLSAAAAPEAPRVPAVPAASPLPAKSVDSAASYGFHRWALKTIAAMTGAVFTLPQAGAALTAELVASAADKQAVFSDYDDTLARYNEVLPSDMVSAIAAVRAAGKDFVVISDRIDEKRPGSTQLTVFESLAPLPEQVRAGMYVAAESGGKVYLYDAQGVPRKVHEAPALVAEKLGRVQAAVAAAKARLPAIGAEQYAGDKTIPAEQYETYSYAMMLKVGSGEKTVRAAAAILQEELSSRGVDVEVNPRVAKNPANPPYIYFSIITKADSTAWIAKALKVAPQDALVIGDSMFVPREGKKANWMTRLGERLSGRPPAKTGNETDRNMAKGLPGVLALGVGANMDPRVPNGYALAGKGPEVANNVLKSVASKKARGAMLGMKFSQSGSVAGVSVLLGMALVAVAAASGIFLGLHLSAGLLSGLLIGGALLTALIFLLDHYWTVLDWRWNLFNLAVSVTLFGAVSGLLGLITLGVKGLLG